VILTATANGLTPVMVLVALALTFRGHNAPGGGFAGGLVMSSAVVLRYLADGPTALARLRFDPVVVTGLGLLVALATAIGPLLVGQPLLTSAIWKLHVPLIGTVKVVSSTFFDLGVFLVVLGVVTSVVLSLVEADQQDADPAGTPPPPGGRAPTAPGGPS
jgi:multisubunit Na+/H+ antiporter MnhB subunit